VTASRRRPELSRAVIGIVINHSFQFENTGLILMSGITTRERRRKQQCKKTSWLCPTKLSMQSSTKYHMWSILPRKKHNLRDLNLRAHTIGRCDRSIASQRRTHHNSTKLVESKVDSSSRLTISSQPLNTDIRTARSLIAANFVVSIDKDTRFGAVIAKSEMVVFVSASTSETVLISDSGGGGLEEDAHV